MSANRNCNIMKEWFIMCRDDLNVVRLICFYMIITMQQYITAHHTIAQETSQYCFVPHQANNKGAISQIVTLQNFINTLFPSFHCSVTCF